MHGCCWKIPSKKVWPEWKSSDFGKDKERHKLTVKETFICLFHWVVSHADNWNRAGETVFGNKHPRTLENKVSERGKCF